MTTPRSATWARGLAPFLLVLPMAACSAVSAPPDPPALPRPVPVFVIARDWHTEIGFRADDLSGGLAALRERFPGARTLVFGFGDRHYITARDPGFLDMLMAALPAPGALLVTGLATTPQAAFGAADVVTLEVTRDGARRAAAYLWGSFAQSPSGAVAPLRDGPYPGSLFYPAATTYALTHTCNTWVAEILQEAGTPVSAEGVLLAHQVMDRARAAQASETGAGENGAAPGALTRTEAPSASVP